MTTPQGMSDQSAVETPPEQTPNEILAEQGFIYRAITRLLGWLMFLGFMILTIGTLTFISLALYKGILWLWPGGEL